MYTKLEFNDFPRVWKIITLPENIIVAKSKAKPGVYRHYDGTGDAYVLKCGLKLADVRTLRYLVIELMMDIEDCTSEDVDKFSNYVNGGLQSFMECYGLVSHETQCKNNNQVCEIKPNRPYPLTQFGSHLPIENAHALKKWAEALTFAKWIFNTNLDGVIAPKMDTLYNTDKTNGYIYLFNHMRCVTKLKRAVVPIVGKKLTTILETQGYKALQRIVNNNIETSVHNGGGSEVNWQGGRLWSFGPARSQPRLGLQGGGAQESNTTFISTDIWVNAENTIENGMSFQCELSKLPELKSFIIDNVLIKLTRLLYHAFKEEGKTMGAPVDTIIINTIENMYYPVYDTVETHSQHVGPPSKTIYVLRPGMRNLNKNGIIQKIVNNDAAVTTLIDNNYSLSEIMGACYGVLTHAGMYTLILQASVRASDYEPLKQLSGKMDGVAKYVASLFALEPTIFTKETLVELLRDTQVKEPLFVDKVCTRSMVKNKSDKCIDTEQISVYDVKKGNMRNIIMDMLISNQYTSGNISIVRTRRQKQAKGSYEDNPKCPVYFNPDMGPEAPKLVKFTIKMVAGNEWYKVAPNGFFQKIMKQNGRAVKAGPSGSTFMWINMLFGILGCVSSRLNYQLLLLCVIADFVPIYHSLTEVLIVYSGELPNEFLGSYTIDQNPVSWLYKHLFDKDASDSDDLSQYEGQTQSQPTNDTISTHISKLDELFSRLLDGK